MREIQTDAYVLRADRIVPGDPGHRTGAAVRGRPTPPDAARGLGPRVRHRLVRLRGVHGGRAGRPAGNLRRRARAARPGLRRHARLVGGARRPSSARAPARGGTSRFRERSRFRTRAARVADALDSTGAALRSAFGDPETWTWGSLHQVTFKESTLGSSGHPARSSCTSTPSRALPRAPTARSTTTTGRRGAPTRTPTTRRQRRSGMDEVFGVAGGPSYRLLVDMSDLNGARIVITTGQSGNAVRPPLIDQIPLWLRGETVALPFSAASILANAAQTLTLARRSGAPRYSLTGSGPSGTSMKMRPSSTTTGYIASGSSAGGSSASPSARSKRERWSAQVRVPAAWPFAAGEPPPVRKPLSSSKYSCVQIPWKARISPAGVDHDDLVRAVDEGHLHRALGHLVDAEEVDASRCRPRRCDAAASAGLDAGGPLPFEQVAQPVASGVVRARGRRPARGSRGR